MTYYVGRNTYKCFVCDAYGGVIDLAMKVLGKGFLETCQWLADAHNVIMTEYQPVRKIEMPVAVDIAHLARLV
jgi:DNA primase